MDEPRAVISHELRVGKRGKLYVFECAACRSLVLVTSAPIHMERCHAFQELSTKPSRQQYTLDEVLKKVGLTREDLIDPN